MRITWIIILILLGANSTQANFSKELVKLCSNYQYQDLKRGLHRMEMQSEVGTAFRSHQLVNRTLVADYSEEIFEVKKSVKDPSNPETSTHYSYRIKLVVQQSTRICYYEVVKMSGGKEEQKKDTSSGPGFLSFQKTFLTTYGSPLLMEQLFKRNIIYGSACGWAGVPPETRLILEEMVEISDTLMLKKMLASANVETQLYAIEGIYRLKRQGVEFQEQTFDIIRVISNKTGTARTCSGCIYSSASIGDIVKSIQKKYK